MREFKERQDMADLAKFKELENLEMDKMGKDADGTEDIAEIVQSKTQQAIEDRRKRLRMQRDLLVK